MSSPYRPQGAPDEPTVAVGGDASEETQVVRPPAVGYGPPPASGPSTSGAADSLRSTEDAGGGAGAGSSGADPFSSPMPPVARAEPYGGAGSWSQAYADDSHSAGPAVTSVYPQSTPEYAPAGYPAAYAPATVVPPPASAAVPEKPSSRVGPGFLSALIGLILVAGGTYLLLRFGYRAGVALAQGKVSRTDSGLGLLGALLLFAATVLNGWSPWSTLLPGIALTGLGGWALFDARAFTRIGSWVRSVLDGGELANALITGIVLALGLVLLGSSVAALLARSGGKRDGRILGRRDIPAA